MSQNQNKLSFKAENLVVDWIGFNIEGSTDIEPIANYLFQSLGFNSILKRRNNAEWKSEVLNYDKLNQFQVSFQQYCYNPEFKSYWVGTKVYFSGNNAAHFYKSIRVQPLHLDIFDFQRTSLARFDINYFTNFQKKNETELINIKTFMEKSCQKIHAKSKRLKADFGVNRKGLLLTIGSRRSNNYYRVYQKNNGLKFELEIKTKFLESFQDLLFSDQMEEFEDRLVKHFYYQSFQLLSVDTDYTNWLIHRIRLLSLNQNNNQLITTYFKKYSQLDLKHQEKIFNLFRLLSFLKNKKFLTQTSNSKILAGQVYCVVSFPLIDFISYIGINTRSHFQRTKVLNILTSLQTLEPITQYFDDRSFQSSLLFPVFKIKKETKQWIVEVALAKQLYFYQYPFQFSNYFTTYKYNYQFQVKLHIIQAISVYSLKKEFSVQDYLYKFNVSNLKKQQIKKEIIEVFQELKNTHLIKKEIQIHKTDNSFLETTILTLKLLNQTKIIYFYEIVDYKSLTLEIDTI